MTNFQFKKKFGQNFLTDTKLLEEIAEVSGVSNSDTVVEIGAGKGALTEVLMKHAKKVVAFEIDKDLEDYLTDKFEGTNVQLVFDDIMRFSEEKISGLTGGKFKLVANLPYYLTSPIIIRFLKNPNLESMTVMVQEEVADRIVAHAKTKDYGVLTVICGYLGNPKKCFRVERQKFNPVPNVDSAVVKIDKIKDMQKETEEFFNFTKKAFSMRRKKLSTCILDNKNDKKSIEETLKKLGLGANIRAEELEIDELWQLFEIFSDKK